MSLSKRQFVEICKAGSVPPLSLKIPFQSPAALYEKLISLNSILLESGKGPFHIARYSFISFDPYLEFKVKNNVIETVRGAQRGISSRKPLAKLRDLLQSYPQKADPALPPFQGGAIGLLSYDFVHYFERLPRKAIDDLSIPDAHFLLIDKLIAFDHKEQTAWIVVCPGARSTRLGYNTVDRDVPSLYDEAEADLLHIKGLCASETRLYSCHPEEASPGDREIHFEIDSEYYRGMVRRAKEYIRAGDIFQANLAQRFSVRLGKIDPWDLYRSLSRINPAPFGAFAHFGDYSIVSSSPERLVSCRDRIAETRPIAGTRPRGKSAREDETMRRELLLNEKERAEHIMLIDLERNDLGKVCEYGTVEVDEFMITEDYSHVIHIVSNVKGMLSPRKDCFDLVRAVFPGGTITGVPKIRCMEIIDELEPVSRGPYTGSIGYIGFSESMDLNIIIRTFVCKSGRAYFHAGAGIVADSDPEKEYQETLRKAEALMATIGVCAK